MKVSELLADLKDHRQDVPVLVLNGDDIVPETMLPIESIIKEKDTVVLLKVRSTNGILREALIETLTLGAGQIHNAKIFKSAMQPGKFQVSIDGLHLMQHFETQADAKLFIQGFTFGFTAGSGSNPDTSSGSLKQP